MHWGNREISCLKFLKTLASRKRNKFLCEQKSEKRWQRKIFKENILQQFESSRKQHEGYRIEEEKMNVHFDVATNTTTKIDLYMFRYQRIKCTNLVYDIIFREMKTIYVHQATCWYSHSPFPCHCLSCCSHQFRVTPLQSNRLNCISVVVYWHIAIYRPAKYKKERKKLGIEMLLSLSMAIFDGSSDERVCFFSCLRLSTK